MDTPLSLNPLLSRTLFPHLPAYPERMIQFGEGNFMRAFTAWQVQQMNQQGRFQGSVVMIKPQGSPVSEHYAKQDHLYTVLINGIAEQQIVREHEILHSVSRLISPYTEYERFLALAEQDSLEFITSNTTEAGITYNPEDRLTDAPQRSFPGKLTALLYRRYQLGKAGFTIIPCELIDRNGEKLREIVLRHAADWNLGDGFTDWLERENTFCCSLVDRIVPGFPQERADQLEQELGYRDRLMVTAEPYLLWVIEGPAWLPERLPLAESGLNVIYTDDLRPYREQKVHLLNGPHTAMTALGLLAGLETVEEVMNDEDLSVFVRELMEEEIVPMLDLPIERLIAYAQAVRERFMNPFIRHELASISLNSIAKFQTRLLPVLLRYRRERGDLPKRITLSFAALLVGYRGDRLERKDSPDVLTLFDRAWAHPAEVIPTLLQEAKLWGEDLSGVPELADTLERYVRKLDAFGARATLQWIGGGSPCGD
ncbi:tagaturonate reductase [Paenibacillus sp. MBLB2552]|uniref:Tagaturonate reductase n=1 Tax=Paenibacillus mellifer TaxID=2937794 RepID=A0A9X2BPY7_9BACL|nr:tagaturonate reductase [Paenibacillus mellifer]MCK8488509.1 tagaturonate reductase [Paenibacillus mellifer]